MKLSEIIVTPKIWRCRETLLMHVSGLGWGCWARPLEGWNLPCPGFPQIQRYCMTKCEIVCLCEIHDPPFLQSCASSLWSSIRVSGYYMLLGACVCVMCSKGNMLQSITFNIQLKQNRREHPHIGPGFRFWLWKTMGEASNKWEPALIFTPSLNIHWFNPHAYCLQLSKLDTLRLAMSYIAHLQVKSFSDSFGVSF